MSSVLKYYKNDNPNVLKLGVLHQPSSNPSKPDVTNYLINEYFLKVVDTMVGQLSINDILLVSIPIKLTSSLTNLDENTKKTIYSTLSSYKDITYFICSFGSEQLEILQEVYFKFNKKITLLSTSSSKTSIKFNDNIVRFLPSDNTLVNFISNYLLNDTKSYYDCVFIGGSFYQLEGKPVFGNQAQIAETIQYINDYLNLTSRNLKNNPIITDNNNDYGFNEISDIIRNTLDVRVNPNYYTSNYSSNYIIQYVQNSINDFSTPDEIVIFNQWLKDYPAPNVINWKVFESFMYPDLTIDQSKLPIIYHFMIYITFFDYSQKKKILLFMSNFQFPAFFAIVSHLIPQFELIFDKTNILINFINKTKIIFTNTQNRDEYTSELFNDKRTDTLWYNTGKTWMDLLNIYNPMIFLPRYDQSINIFINKLSLELNMYTINNKYVDLTKTSQVLLIPIYNSIQFVYHFYKNGIIINNFVLNYFLKSTLLYFGNNLIFDENMDNVFNIIIGTGYFDNKNAVINRSLTTTRGVNYNLELVLDSIDPSTIDLNYILSICYPITNRANWLLFYDQYNYIYGNIHLNNKSRIFKQDNGILTSPYQLSIIIDNDENKYNLKVSINGSSIDISDHKERILNLLLQIVHYQTTNPFGPATLIYTRN